MTTDSEQKAVEFYQLWPEAPLPQRADPSIVGSISLRAFQYCEPFTAASGFGWYLYPPIDFDIIWDGRATMWRRTAPLREWQPLRIVVGNEIGTALAAHFDRTGKQFPGCFPFLSHAPESGVIQIWSGLVVRTPPGQVSLVRPLANYPRDSAYDVLEGIIETDWWVGPLLSPIRIVKSDVVIEFRQGRPFAQLQLIPKTAYSPKTLSAAVTLAGAERMNPDLWESFSSTLVQISDPERRPGSYKHGVRIKQAS